MKRVHVLIFAVLLFIVCTESAFAADTYDKSVIIGAKTFNEQYILADMAGLLLEDKGYTTDIKSGMNDLTLYEGMKKGQIDLYVEYTGTAYSQILKLPARDSWDPDAVYTDVVKGFKVDNIDVVGKIGFRDDYSIAVPETYAKKNGITTVSDLVKYAPDLRFGSDLVFHEREDGLPRLESVYGLSFKSVTPMSPTLMYTAIENNEVDAIPPYTTDSRIDLYNLTVLTDDKSAMPPYHAILL
ncbi:MAG: glycine/betaine ABC transporter substrate-binding protein, partial [Methanomicrobiales archaeon HGW-Methanomicrobiales-4]